MLHTRHCENSKSLWQSHTISRKRLPHLLSQSSIGGLKLLNLLLLAIILLSPIFSDNANAANDPIFGAAQATGDIQTAMQYCQDLRGGSFDNRNGFIVSTVKCFTDSQQGLFQAVTTKFLTATQAFYKPMIMAMAVVALTFFGIKLIYSDVHNLKKEAFTLLFKIAIIFYFIDYAPNIYSDFLTIMNELNSAMSSIATAVSPNAMCASSTMVNLDGSSVIIQNTLWGRYDCMFGILFSFTGPSTVVVGLSTAIALLFFTAGTGVLIFFAALYMLFALFFAVVRFLHIYIMAVLSFSFMFCLGYLFVPLMLFNRTMAYFQKWLIICLAYILTPVIMFGYMGMMSIAMDMTLLSGQYSVLKSMFGQNANGDSFGDLNCQSNIVYSQSQTDANGQNVTSDSPASSSCFQQGIAQVESGGQKDPTHTFSGGCSTKSIAADCPYGQYQMKPSTAQYISKQNDEVFDAQQFANNPAYQAKLNQQYTSQLTSGCSKMGVAQADMQSCVAFSYNRGPTGAKNYTSTCGIQFASAAFASCVKATGKTGSTEGANYISKVNNDAAACTNNGGVLPGQIASAPSQATPNTGVTTKSTMASNILGKFCNDNMKNLFYLGLDNSGGGKTPVDMGSLGDGRQKKTGWSDTGQKASTFQAGLFQPAVGFDSKKADLNGLANQAAGTTGTANTSNYLVTLLISICVAALMAYIMLSLLTYIPDLAAELVSQGENVGRALVKSEVFGEARIMHFLEMTKDAAYGGAEKMATKRK